MIQTVQDLQEYLEGFEPHMKVRIAMLPEQHSYTIDNVDFAGHRAFEGEEVCYIYMGTQESYDYQETVEAEVDY